jgi:integrase
VSILGYPSFDPAPSPAAVGDQPAALQIPSSGISVEASKAQPLRRETRKSMSRRSGQGSKPFPAGKWWRVRARFDAPGVEKRQQRSLKVCLVSERLPMPVIERKAKEVIAASGANSEEHFNRVVLGEGVTFREQAKIWLQEATTRNRRPIRNITSIQGALNKWINPVIGDMTLSVVDNVRLKPLVKKLVKSGLAPETIRKYVEYVKKVMSSKLAPNGEPLYPRVWSATVMDLPLVVYSKQKRPALKAEGISALLDAAESDEEKYLYVLLAATGMRVSEALALEARHFINSGRTIVVEQQVDKDRPRIVNYLKTDASWRQIDLHPDVAAYLMNFVSGKAGLILKTENNTPFLYGNLQDHWLDPRLEKFGLSQDGGGWHQFKRFRNSWLRAPAQQCQEDLRKYWLAHKPKDMGELYSALKEDLPTRLGEAERVGYGFVLPKEVVPNVPRKGLFVVTRKIPATGILINRMTETMGV